MCSNDVCSAVDIWLGKRGWVAVAGLRNEVGNGASPKNGVQDKAINGC